MKRWLLILPIVIIAFAVEAQAQLLLVEDFDYPAGAGDSLVVHGWTPHSGRNLNPLMVVTPGLTYTGYAGSGVGNKTVATGGSGSREDANRTFVAQSSGTVYTAFLANVGSATSGDYFFHMGPQVIGTNFSGRVYVKTAANGSLSFGLIRRSGWPTAWTDSIYTAGITYLIVLKYEFGVSTSLFINPVIGSPEPTALLSAGDGSEISDVGCIAIRQGSVSQSVSIDGFRVATDWATAVASGGSTTNTPPNISSLTRSPWIPTALGDADLSAHVTDDHTVTAVKVIYSSGSFTDSVDMDPVGGNDYQAVLPGTLYPTDGTVVSYYFKATDDSGAVTQTGSYNFLAGTTPIEILRNNDANGVSIYHGWPVRVRGIVTAGDSVFSATNIDIFVQDATSGVNIFRSGNHVNYSEGTDLTVEGTVTHFNGKLEVSTPNIVFVVNSTGNPVPEPVVITPDQLDSETYEGMLVIVTNVDFDASGTFTITGSGVNYFFNNDTDLVVRIDIDTDDINGTPIPEGAVNVRGIVAQFDQTSAYLDSFQLMPRRLADINVIVDVVDGPAPREFRLSQNFPNPFNPTTTIAYELANSAHVTLKVYNLLGQEVRSLFEGRREAGAYTSVWDGRDEAGRAMASGIYFYRLNTSGFVRTRKMVLVK